MEHWKQQVIAEVLQQSKSVISVFVAHHLDCIGCPMNRICTLEDLSEYYDLELDLFIEQVKAVRQMRLPGGV